MDAKQTPLIELLERVPADARLVIDDADGMGARFIPVGRLCHEAAAALRKRQTQPADANPDPLHLSRILHELAGAASLCWTPHPSGVFDSQEAIKHVESAIAEIRDRLAQPEHDWEAEYAKQVELHNQTLDELRDALAQPEQDDEPATCWKCGEDGGTSCGAEACGLIEAQPEQEPVEWRELLREARDNCKASIVEEGISASRKEYRIDLEARLTAALNTSPPQRKPLTDERITQVIDSMPNKFAGFMIDWDLYEFTRAIEAAHGIKEKNNG